MKTFRSLSLALVATLLVGCSSLSSIDLVDRARRFATTPHKTVGSSLTPCLPLPGSAEVTSYIYSTTVGERMTEVRFPAGSAPKVCGSLEVGSFVIVEESMPVPGQPNHTLAATRWHIHRQGNPARTKLLRHPWAADLILIWEFRKLPSEIDFIFESRPGDLREIARDIEPIHAMLLGVLGEEPSPAPVAAAPQECPESPGAMECAVASMRVSSVLTRIESIAMNHKDGDHHGVGAIAREGQSILDSLLEDLAPETEETP
ncbi:MAG: hypothetical protein R3253_08900 [Longimicrobiales bacterium]|nr:hypothetical protein [Longimicrobiales bacterium]